MTADPPGPARLARPGRGSLLGLVLALAALSLVPDHLRTGLPVHDTRQQLMAFHLLASGLATEGGPPLWTPAGSYGTSSEAVLLKISPFEYLVAALGTLAGARDLISLHELGVLLELLVLAVGMFRLGWYLFRHAWPVLLVCLGSILTFSWYASNEFGFHACFFLPLILEQVFRYCDAGRPAHLVSGLALCVFSAVGNTPYYAPGAAVLLATVVAAMALQGAVPAPRGGIPRGSVAVLAGTLAVAGAFVGLYLGGFEGHSWVASGRDPATGKVPLEVFLTHGGVAKPGMVVEALVTGAHLHGDTTFYLGLLPLALFPLALGVRDPRCVALVVAAGTTAMVSFGGPVATLAYRFPGMDYFHHIGLLYGQVRILVLLGAGFALDSLLDRLEGRVPRPGGPTMGLVLEASLLVVAGLEVAAAARNPAAGVSYLLLPSLGAHREPFALRVLGARLAGYATLGGLGLALGTRRRGPGGRWRPVLGLTMVAFALDVASFKLLGLAAIPAPTPESTARAALVAHPLAPVFQPFRRAPGTLEAGSPLLRALVARTLPRAEIYSQVYPVTGEDPSLPAYRTDSVPKGLRELFAVAGAPVGRVLAESAGPHLAGDPWLARALGVTAPKLRLVGLPDLVEVDGDLEEPRPFRDAPPPAGRIDVLAFTHDRIDLAVRVDGPEAAWLYYADGFHPGWSARLDDLPAGIRRANRAFKAVVVPPGNHRIELAFASFPGSFCLRVLFLASLVFVPGLAAWSLQAGPDAGVE